MPILDLGSVRGPQGIQGIQGPEGKQGPIGPIGETGPQGPIGPQGIQGIQGPEGKQGIQGEIGPVGPQGPEGPAGKDYVLTDADKAEIAGMVETPELYKIGDGLYHADNNEIGVMIDGTMGINDIGEIGVNENNLFAINNMFMPVDTMLDHFSTGNTRIVFGVGSQFGPEDTNAFIADMANNEVALLMNIRTNTDGWGSTIVPEVMENATAVNGETFDYIFNMTDFMGPNTRENLGIIGVYVCYKVEDNLFRIIIDRNKADSFGELEYVGFGLYESERTLAHYFIGRERQFRTFNDDGRMILEINEDYINDLIDEKLSGIAMAEEVSV
jgi:hypothetical protein